MTHAPSNRAPAADGGFVLVGVVMFVLALTILGLSLFNLSSYEGQFMSRSYDSGQALLSAQSGLEHAKFVLAKTRSLDQVQTSLFPSGVDYARAKRLDTNKLTGSIDDLPQGQAVELTVRTLVNGERRMVQTQYIPFQTPNVYKRLMSVVTEVHVKQWLFEDKPEDDATNPYLQGQTYLSGDIRQGSPLEPWVMLPPPAFGVHYLSGTREQGFVPMPDVSGFFAQHYATAQDVSGGSQPLFDLTTGTNPDVNYYRSANQDPLGRYSVSYDTGNPVIHVSGIAVWMFPMGFRAGVQTNVVGVGPGPNCLIMVGKSGNDPTADDPTGVWFFASFNAINTSVILVSDARVVDEHFASALQVNSAVGSLTIFAQKAMIAGPKLDAANPSEWHMNLTHDTSVDATNGLIDKICDLEAVPNSDTGGMSFTSVAGTWHELDPGSPPYP